MSGQLKIIQVGVGFWGVSWIKKVLESPYWELAGLVIRRKERQKEVCLHYPHLENFMHQTLERALKDTEADAVLITVPPEATADVTLRSLESGMHCLIEKPMAMTIKDAQNMVNTASRHSRKLMISQNYRFKRGPRTVKHFVDRDMIGEIGSVFINFQKNLSFTGFRAEMEEPLIRDMSIHHFDLVRGVLGLEPKMIHANSWNPRWSTFKGNPAVSIVFEMQNGAFVSYLGNWVSQGWETSWDGDWRIQGDGGEIAWARNDITIKPTDFLKLVYSEGASETSGKLHADMVTLPAEDRSACLMEFARSISDDREPETSGRDNINTLAMVIGAYTSIKQRRPVAVEEILEG